MFKYPPSARCYSYKVCTCQLMFEFQEENGHKLIIRQDKKIGTPCRLLLNKQNRNYSNDLKSLNIAHFSLLICSRIFLASFNLRINLIQSRFNGMTFFFTH